MFGKKKEHETWSYEDKQVHALINSMVTLRKQMEGHIRTIMIHEGSANMLPDGADKKIELAEANKRKTMLLNSISAYDEDYRAFKAIDKTKLIHYYGLAEQMTSHKALNIAWRLAKESL